MFSFWTLAGVLLSYLILLFVIAFVGDRYVKGHKQRPVIYSLAMGVHCTSWAFFGTTTQATQYGWAFIPTYLGIILVMLLGYSLLQRITSVCHQHKISSLADFIGLQYNKSHLLAAMISILCFFGVVPYIALQLDAVSRSFAIISQDNEPWQGNLGLYITCVMALFAIVFGTRSMRLTDKHPGLMLTVAFESIVKLVALLCVGLFVCYGLYNGVYDLIGQAYQHPVASKLIHAEGDVWLYFSHIILGICAMFCLPRQFHINFIENNGEQELRTARWMFPLYLTLMTLFVLPIGLAGHMLFETGAVSTDTYVLAIPLASGSASITLVGFIGGIAAATSMIIVATLAVGVMISNNLVTPLWFKLQLASGLQETLRPKVLLLIRRLTVLLVLGVAYLYYLNVSRSVPLVNSGIVAMALLAQTLPIMLLGMFWSKRDKRAAQIALITGACGWFYWLFYPSFIASYYFASRPTDSELGNGFIYSLLANLVCFVLLSFLFSRGRTPLPRQSDQTSPKPAVQAIPIANLLGISAKVLHPNRQEALLRDPELSDTSGYASKALITKVENELAAQVGRASARILLSAVAEKDLVPLPELVDLVEEASQSFQFNHELLQSSVEHIQQGICVLDQHLQLLAWNQRYAELFGYPNGTLQVGTHIRQLLEFNAARGMFGDKSNQEKEIAKRIGYMQQGSQYKYVRHQDNGKVIEINGSALPSGGFVTTYSDITEYIAIQQQLQQAKEELESRVEQRTEQLKVANSALEKAKLQAELANESKSKFLAAASHDLMQPLNAAGLFAELLAQQATQKECRELSQNIRQSLSSAEELLSMLLDMSKLESGVLTPHLRPFCIDELLAPLVREFSIIAKQKGLQLVYARCGLTVVSDKKLLRRILQNLLSNALRYTEQGRVLLGVKRRQEHAQICVIDTGPGISVTDQKQIFKEFHQLENRQSKLGLGLGLTIVERIGQLLGHPIQVYSIEQKGSCFAVNVPRVNQPAAKRLLEQVTSKQEGSFISGKRILVVENDEQTLRAVSELLSSWNSDVMAARSLKEATAFSEKPHMMLLDYHLDQCETGVQVAKVMREKWQTNLPGIINSAIRSDDIRNEVARNDLYYLPKPLKPAAFKRLARQVLS